MKKQVFGCFLVSFTASIPAYALLDFVGDMARDAAKGSAYVGVVSELANELSESSEITDGINSIEKRSDSLRSLSSSLQSEKSDFEDLFDPNNWSSKQLDHNIRYTDRLVKRLKRIFLTSSSLGADVATAVNTAETNGAIKEVLKNQQAQILLEKERALKAEERALKEEAKWNSFISEERRIRQGVKR